MYIPLGIIYFKLLHYVNGKFTLCVSDNPVFKSSMNYGLVLLLRFWLLSNGQKAPTNDFEKMPSTNDTSIQADLSRIYLSKKDISITDLEPVGAWETVFQVSVQDLFILSI